MSEDAITDLDAIVEHEEAFAPEEKFANPRDHLGRTAVEVRRLCSKTDECKCPVCSHRLIVRGGERVSVHLAHAPGRKDTACKGGFESPWHVAAKQAAAYREGWLHEQNGDGDRGMRFDAYNKFTREAFEAVHSLSDTYASKQLSICRMGVEATWLFDSAADFGNKNPMPLDIDQACGGLLECHGLLKDRAIRVINDIGSDRCFLHYLGLAWKWVGVDRWQVCSPASEMHRICTGEFGINRLLFEMRASGKYGDGKIVFRNGDIVGATWQEISPQKILQRVQEQKDQLLEDWIRVKRSRAYAARRRASRQYRPSTAEDVASRSKPVCELMAERTMTIGELDDSTQICESILSQRQTQDPLAKIHKTWREYCFSQGWLEKG
jgi:hypothetical protein